MASPASLAQEWSPGGQLQEAAGEGWLWLQQPPGIATGKTPERQTLKLAGRVLVRRGTTFLTVSRINMMGPAQRTVQLLGGWGRKEIEHKHF